MVWKAILKVRNLVMGLVGFGVGDGSQVRFWHDRWCGEVALKDSFPRLYMVARDRDGVVVTAMEWVGDVLMWGPSFRRALRDEEEGDLTTLLGMLGRAKVRRHGEDFLTWEGGGGSTFSVRALYKAISYKEGVRFRVKAIGGKGTPLG